MGNEFIVVSFLAQRIVYCLIVGINYGVLCRSQASSYFCPDIVENHRRIAAVHLAGDEHDDNAAIFVLAGNSTLSLEVGAHLIFIDGYLDLGFQLFGKHALDIAFKHFQILDVFVVTGQVESGGTVFVDVVEIAAQGLLLALFLGLAEGAVFVIFHFDSDNLGVGAGLGKHDSCAKY